MLLLLFVGTSGPEPTPEPTPTPAPVDGGSYSVMAAPVARSIGPIGREEFANRVFSADKADAIKLAISQSKPQAEPDRSAEIAQTLARLGVVQKTLEAQQKAQDDYALIQAQLAQEDEDAAIAAVLALLL